MPSDGRQQSRRPTPRLPPVWRWGFPVLALLVATLGFVLLFSGLSTVLDSRRGETREAVTDPSAPGFEAFVEQTWSMLIATEDLSGELVQVAVVAASDRGGNGGTVLLIPVELPVEIGGGDVGVGCGERGCNLVDHHRVGGLERVRAAVASVLDVEVTAATLLTPERWKSLAGSVGSVPVNLAGELVAASGDGTSVVRFPAGTAQVAASDVVDFFSFPGEVGGAGRIDRQRDWWKSWMSAVGSGKPDTNLPALDLDVIHLLGTVAGGRVRVPVGPWTGGEDVPTIDQGRLVDLVVAMFPVPIPQAPGLRPTVRLLNGTGDRSVDSAARQAVLRAGVELVVVGNYRSAGVIQTRVLHRDPADQPAAAALAAALGGGVLHDEFLSPVTDLTVVIGSDFRMDGH